MAASLFFSILLVALILVSVGVKVDSKKGGERPCPNYRENQGCNTGPCKKGGLNGYFKIPSNCPYLVGYGNGSFYLSGDLEDDTELNGTQYIITASQTKAARKCCIKCKQARNCTVYQWLNLGAYGGICFIYMGGKGPDCSNDVVVLTKVGAKCKTQVTNDPHLVGAHGTHFDFSGEPDKTFCLISDSNIHINMKLTGYLDDRTESATVIKNGKAVRTWIKEAAVMWLVDGTEYSLWMRARGGSNATRGNGFLAHAAVNGNSLPTMEVGDEFKMEGGLTIKLEAVEKYGVLDVDYYTVNIADLLDMDVRIRAANPLLQRPDDAEYHLSLGINWVKTTPLIHGVLGQTYREGREDRAIQFSQVAALLHHSIVADGESGKGFLDGALKDYESSGIMEADCRFSAFQETDSFAVTSA